MAHGGGGGKVVDIDHGYRALMSRMRTLGKPSISVGLHAKEGGVLHKPEPGQKNTSPVTVLAVGTWAEFGLGQPARSWLRAWYDATRSSAHRDIKKMMALVLAGKMPLEQALNKLGLRFVGQIQQHISMGIAPANRPRTIAKKGSSTPLINTGQFRSSLTYAVEGVVGESNGGGQAAAAE
jgi:hypothetical protein